MGHFDAKKGTYGKQHLPIPFFGLAAWRLLPILMIFSVRWIEGVVLLGTVAPISQPGIAIRTQISPFWSVDVEVWARAS